MTRLIFAALVLLLPITSANAASFTISTEPATPIVEITRGGQSLNFDILLRNTGSEAREIEHFEITVRDAKGHMVMQRRVGQNGNTIEVIPARTVEPKGQLLIFNPLWQWPAGVTLDHLELALLVSSRNGESEILKHTVKTQVRVSQQPLRIPLSGDVFVHAAHEFTSHHRRFPLHSAMTDALGIRHSATRYAYDFALVNARGDMHSGDGKKLTDWFGYGSAVLAPAAGSVVEVHDGQPDNEIGRPPRLDRDAIMKNPKLLYGNYVLIDHGNGELSMLAHLQPGSLAVRAGDRVSAQQLLARVGMSGDAAIVHLHYQMQSGRGFDDGIPVRFADFERKLGDRWQAASIEPIEEGEIVRTREL